MRRIGAVAFLAALAGAAWMQVTAADAQGAPSGVRMAQAVPQDQFPSRRAHRPATRLRVYPRVYPPYDYWPHDVYPRQDLPPDAVRECNATYVQEYRPSGTVIVPRMSCYWRRG